ncbi:LysR family transcriptional regulator [Mesorhizobium xinjiangense]|uniref:LysR family transcriptional regulator n=1 Tax=Mesorhizobium xinjiangense TaxID=2678685 RepID=UPI0012ED8432|nr:LysR family transcriptional regulator [Mesorhizobium xinjiangense]
MSRNQLDAVVAFLHVVEHRSFRAAAADLGVSPSAVSQLVRTLEASAGVTLLSRTTRSVGLTEAGALFLERAQPAVDQLDDAFDVVREFGGRPSGLLRLNAPRGVIPFLIGPVLDGFAKAHPDIEIELFADDGFADIVAGGFDAGIRVGEYLQADMVALRLSPPFRFCIAAAPDYLAARGTPQRPEDLKAHDCIRFRQTSSGAIYRWELDDGEREIEMSVAGRLIVNDTPTMLAAARRGAGLIYGAEPTIAEDLADGRLVGVLESYWPHSPGLFLYYPSRAQALPKLRVFIDFMRGAAADFAAQMPRGGG